MGVFVADHDARRCVGTAGVPLHRQWLVITKSSSIISMKLFHEFNDVISLLWVETFLMFGTLTYSLCFVRAGFQPISATVSALLKTSLNFYHLIELIVKHTWRPEFVGIHFHRFFVYIRSVVFRL